MYIKKSPLSKSANNFFSSYTPPRGVVSRTNPNYPQNKLNIIKSKNLTPYEMKFYTAKCNSSKYVNISRSPKSCNQTMDIENRGKKSYYNDFYKRFKWQTEQVCESVDLSGKLLHRSKTPLNDYSTSWTDFINKTPDEIPKKDIGCNKAFNNYVQSRINTKRTITPESDIKFSDVESNKTGKKVFRSKSCKNIVDLMNKSSEHTPRAGKSILQLGRISEENGKIFDFSKKTKKIPYRQIRKHVNMEEYKKNNEYAGKGGSGSRFLDNLRNNQNKNGNYGSYK